MTSSLSSLTNLAIARCWADEILRTEPDAVAWFRYGATYVMNLLRAVDFYNSTQRNSEAEDILYDLRHKLAAADRAETIARNLLRLGVCWDEIDSISAMGPDTVASTPIDELLNTVRRGKPWN